MSERDLKGQVAIVTGGSKGIGKAIAGELLKKGVTVMICGRDGDAVNAAVADLTQFGNVVGAVCDVRDVDQVARMFDKAEEVYGRIDILVNNAGIGIMGKTVEEISPAEFRDTIETNLFGIYNTCHFVVPIMKKLGGGYILNISSLAGQNAHPKMAAYNASKFAVNGFTEALMQEVRQDDIKVSYVCPGSVNTDFGGGTTSEENAWQLQPDDIAQVVVDLLNMDPRALPSKVEIRPSKPPVR